MYANQFIFGKSEGALHWEVEVIYSAREKNVYIYMYVCIFIYLCKWRNDEIDNLIILTAESGAVNWICAEWTDIISAITQYCTYCKWGC